MTKILSSIDSQGLAALEARLKDDLDLLCFPSKDWIPRKGRV